MLSLIVSVISLYYHRVQGSSHTVLLSQKGCVFGKSVEKGTNKGTHLYYETAADYYYYTST